MKLLVVFAWAGAVLAGAGPAVAQWGTGSNPDSHYNSGYVRRDGTYVAPHYSTNPNNTQRDNYGTQGNYNPNTGAYGTRRPGW